MSPRTVFLVDDHPLVREGLANLIARERDLAVCGQAADEAEALAGIAATQPKAVVVDLTLQGGSGLRLIKEIVRRHPAIAVVVLTMHDEALYAERTSRAGARGYVMKQETTGRIVAALRRVLGGGTYWSDRAVALLEERAAENRPAEELPAHALLSDRELEVFELLGQGRETREIAECLEISFKTVQAYCARIKEKLGLNNATELLRAAIRHHESRLAP
jgi:DNA-binding NarL/FixJ family response regulator